MTTAKLPKNAHGWVLITPACIFVPCTFSTSIETTQQLAFDYLYSRRRRYKWAEKYWKDWPGFVRARVKRGWHVIPVQLTDEYVTPLFEEPNQ